MDIEISLSCHVLPEHFECALDDDEISIETHRNGFSLTFRNTHHLPYDEALDAFLSKLQTRDCMRCIEVAQERILRVGFFISPADGVAFLSCDIAHASLLRIGELGAGLEIHFYPCSD